ncbi:MAG: hypothetical protein OER86_07495, partial [Phycisphaerae bacterium]|nr:hypothetical protein [Phycisphaerae bacterium]
MLRQLAHAFSPHRFPRMTRPSYRRELSLSLTFPIAVSLVEGGVVGVLARKVFAVSDFQLAMITAAPMFANLTSFAWARIGRGRRKVPMIAGLMAATLACVGGIGLVPPGDAGRWPLVGLVVLSRCLLAGIITFRSTVWRHNYPRDQRATITGRLAVLAGCMVFVTPLGAAVLFDFDEASYRYVYPAAVVVAAFGVISFRRLRLRGEAALLRFEGGPNVRPNRHGDAAGIWEYDDRDGRPGMWAVLRGDPIFRRYMVCQFVVGVSNMMLEPVVILIAAERTAGMSASFFTSILLTQALPAMLMIATVSAWARFLDRVHITRFRISQGSLWVLAQGLMLLGAAWSGSLVGGLVVLGLGRLVLGVARGGGVLAWN